MNYISYEDKKPKIEYYHIREDDDLIEAEGYEYYREGISRFLFPTKPNKKKKFIDHIDFIYNIICTNRDIIHQFYINEDIDPETPYHEQLFKYLTKIYDYNEEDNVLTINNQQDVIFPVYINDLWIKDIILKECWGDINLRNFDNIIIENKEMNFNSSEKRLPVNIKHDNWHFHKFIVEMNSTKYNSYLHTDNIYVNSFNNFTVTKFKLGLFVSDNIKMLMGNGIMDLSDAYICSYGRSKNSPLYIENDAGDVILGRSSNILDIDVNAKRVVVNDKRTTGETYIYKIKTEKLDINVSGGYEKYGHTIIFEDVEVEKISVDIGLYDGEVNIIFKNLKSCETNEKIDIIVAHDKNNHNMINVFSDHDKINANDLVKCRKLKDIDINLF